MNLKTMKRVGLAVLIAASFASAANASLWSGGTANWSSNANPGWNGTGVPNAVGAVADFPAIAAATNATLTAGNPATVGSINYSGSGNFALTITPTAALTLDQNSILGDLSPATVTNSNPTVGTSNALILSTGIITLADDLLISNTGGSSNTTGAVQVIGTVGGTGSIVLNNVSSSALTQTRSIRFQTGVNTFNGSVLVAKGTTTYNNGSSFGNTANVITLGQSGQGDAALLSTAAFAEPHNIIVAAGSGGTLSLGTISTSTPSYSGTITLNDNLNLFITSSGTLTFNNSIIGGTGKILNLTNTTGGNYSFNTDLNTFSGTFKTVTGNSAVGGASSVVNSHVVNGQNAIFDISVAGGSTDLATAPNRFFRFGLNGDLAAPTSSMLKMGALTGNGWINPQTGNNGAPTPVSYAATNYEVGALNIDTVFSGGIIKRGLSTFTKVGTASLTLSGPNAYNGNTVVSAGTLIAGANVSTSTVVDTPATMPVGDLVTMTGHGLTVGDRLMSSVTGGAGITTTTNYVVHTVVDANTFKIALALTPGTVVSATTAPTALTFTQQSAFGAGNVDIQLGDANTGSNNVNLLIGGAFTVERGVNVTSNGSGITTIGGNTNNNSIFSGQISLAKNIDLTSAALSGNKVNFDGAISSSGAFGINKVGPGNVTLSAANSYSGNTTITSGTLALTGTSTIANSPLISVGSSSIFDVSSLSSTFTLGSGQTIKGNGTVAGPFATTLGSHIAPGNSPGVLTYTSSVDMSAGGSYDWEIGANLADSPSGIPGQDWDEIVVNANLTLGGSSVFAADFSALAAVDQPGTVNPYWQNPHAWIIADVAGTTTGSGYSSVTTTHGAASQFTTIVGDGVSPISTLVPGTNLSLVPAANDVYLVYIPEPSTYLLAGLGMLGLSLYRRRKVVC